jgi:hypothetical protein
MSLLPPSPKIITQDDLKSGDILLSCGDSYLDKAITMIDQGDYSHTTQYIGKENGSYMVVEATTKGALYHDTAEHFLAQNLIDAYRFVSSDGNRLGDPGWPSEPLTDKAMSYAGANELLSIFRISFYWKKICSGFWPRVLKLDH